MTTFTAPRPADIDAIMLEARRLRAEMVRDWGRAAYAWTRARFQITPQSRPA